MVKCFACVFLACIARNRCLNKTMISVRFDFLCCADKNAAIQLLVLCVRIWLFLLLFYSIRRTVFNTLKLWELTEICLRKKLEGTNNVPVCRLPELQNVDRWNELDAKTVSATIVWKLLKVTLSTVEYYIRHFYVSLIYT